MGFLDAGTPLSWPDSQEVIAYVRKHGVSQLLELMKQRGDIKSDVLMWGDEIEYHIVSFDDRTRNVKVSLRGKEIVDWLSTQEVQQGRQDDNLLEEVTWHPEYGSWMVEATPRAAYGGYTKDLVQVEKNMRSRRARLTSALRVDEAAVTTVAFPLLGCGDFTTPPAKPMGAVANSKYIPDECINPHPRFATLTRNIRLRRGENVKIDIPAFQDKHTAIKTVDMDAMAFGMGMCCLQVTFQCRDMGESRHLYDQLAVLAPVMMALTAACPILRGHLVDTDARWDTIAASVDDRTAAERGESPQQEQKEQEDESKASDASQMAGAGKRRIFKSRYDSISCFICHHKEGNDPHSCTEKFNDLPMAVDEGARQQMLDGGADAVLANHVGHLFVRDPLVVFKEKVKLDDSKSTDHWENIQSTNWQSVRWKPPPKLKAQAEADTSHTGWRTEFRSMEVQLTDFENAAFTVFTVLASRVILAFDLNLYIPISKVDENMKRAHARNAYTEQKFWFRKHLAPPSDNECKHKSGPKVCAVHADHDLVEEMTVLEIMIGKGQFYPGLISLINAYLDTIQCDISARKTITNYLDFIVQRASGEILTAAAWMRKFVTSHREYQHDSVVSQHIAFDLLKACEQVGNGTLHITELLGSFKTAPINASEAYPKRLNAESLNSNSPRLSDLINRYKQRSVRATKRRKLTKAIEIKSAELEKLQAELEKLNQEQAAGSPHLGAGGSGAPPSPAPILHSKPNGGSGRGQKRAHFSM